MRRGPLQPKYIAGNVKTADVALPIAQRFANSNIDKLRIFALTEYLPATADVENACDKLDTSNISGCWADWTISAMFG